MILSYDILSDHGLLFALGFLSWSLLEYGMHNWNGHQMKGKSHFSKEHLRHHRDPTYEQSTRRKVLQAMPVAAVVYCAGGLTLGWLSGGLFLGGLVLAYLCYEYAHWSAHALPPKTRFGRWMRRHHFYHHFTDARYNHGFTSPLWDLVFRTYRTPDVIRVPRRMAMVWLVNPETQEVWPEFQCDYTLR